MEKVKIKYQPHKFQEKFHSSSARTRLLLSGIRGGKTMAGCVESIGLALSGWKTFSTPNVGCIVSETYPMLRDVVNVAFEELCPAEIIQSFNKSEFTYTIINGSKILFRSAEHPDRLRGLDLQWYWIDEARNVKEEVDQILRGRIAQKQGCGFLTTTPRMGWLQKIVESNDPETDVIKFTSYDNPYFPEDAINSLKKIYTEDFFEQEIMGKFITVKGAVFKEFDRRAHTQEVGIETIRTIVGGVDFGYENPTAVVIIGYDGYERVCVLKELFQSGLLITELIQHLKELRDQFRVDAFYCDPSRPDSIQQIKEAGVVAFPGDNKVFEGINKINSLLKMKRLFISSKCQNLLRELESYRYREGTDKPMKIDDHCVDALRYAIMSERPVEEGVGLGAVF